MSSVTDYGDVVVNPTIETAEDLAVWYRRLDFIGYPAATTEPFIREVGHLPGLTAGAAKTMDRARQKAYDVTRDPCRLSLAIMRHDIPQLVDLPDLLVLDDELSEIDRLQAEVNRLEGEIARRRAEARMDAVLNTAASA